jgi:hypothetical protein
LCFKLLEELLNLYFISVLQRYCEKGNSLANISEFISNPQANLLDVSEGICSLLTNLLEYVGGYWQPEKSSEGTRTLEMGNNCQRVADTLCHLPEDIG